MSNGWVICTQIYLQYIYMYMHTLCMYIHIYCCRLPQYKSLCEDSYQLRLLSKKRTRKSFSSDLYCISSPTLSTSRGGVGMNTPLRWKPARGICGSMIYTNKWGAVSLSPCSETMTPHGLARGWKNSPLNTDTSTHISTFLLVSTPLICEAVWYLCHHYYSTGWAEGRCMGW